MPLTGNFVLDFPNLFAQSMYNHPGYYAAGLAIPYLVSLAISSGFRQWHWALASLLVRILNFFYSGVSVSGVLGVMVGALVMYSLSSLTWRGGALMCVANFGLNAMFVRWRKTDDAAVKRLAPHERIKFPEPC